MPDVFRVSLIVYTNHPCPSFGKGGDAEDRGEYQGVKEVMGSYRKLKDK
mgnify:CR=1 FL=1